ncbi:type I polyketide synthase [Amycolatopsis nigrescens]|uniref:type I polyketide synthase n=1 Tax=Amycolatopsis nigrescens TaxID=381445 RepID=UPI00039B73DE|nr:type I polyketide synthase [Amycolatopsis nigrescens]
MSLPPPGEPELRRWLIDRIALLTGLRPESIDPERPLRELGVSSRDAIVVATELSELTGRDLPAGLLWQQPTVAMLAGSLAGGDPADPVEPVRARAADGEPMAVIGMGCRLPGDVESPEDFWRLLVAGTDAIGPVPDGRWADFTGADGFPRHGGFLADVTGFDADFFGISADEATLMDPQQRILLEVTWAALEQARVSARSLRGSRTGVFVGISSAEYGHLTMGGSASTAPWTATGAAASIAANRLSYQLDLRGPSVVVDTACSSSLVAVHQAVRGLRDGEIDLAVVGGVNLMLTPEITATFHRAGALAGNARCKAFDAAADGIVRGEGCGVVLLKRLADARVDGDRVLAVVRGSAVNSDGRSNGLTAPNPAAQRALLADAHAIADSDPSTVDYVEAHGAGTLLGDPIEAQALTEVLGRGRDRGRPLLLGSVKTNLGHLEGAAGVIGLIKTVLALWHGKIPPSLHFTEPNPHIDFHRSALSVVTEPTNWPRYAGTPARAGVSAFGFGGTNAHVVLEEWPFEPNTSAAAGERWGSRPHVFALSAHTDAALRQRARDLVGWLDSPGGKAVRPDELAGALAARDHQDRRAVLVVPARSRLVEGLRSLAVGTPNREVLLGNSRPACAGPVFVFSGYGSHWPAMGKRLLSTEPEFRAAVDALEPIFLAKAGFSLRSRLRSSHPSTDPAVVQPTLFGMQVALAALWRAHGVEPAAVLGHSMGEVAAAVVAGALAVPDGLWTVATRSRLLSELSASGAGAMAVVELSATELAELGERFPGVSVAVYTSPTQCTISGDAAEVAALVAYAESIGKLARRLTVTSAGHSPAVDAVLAEFRAGLGTLPAGPPLTTFYSSVLDDPRGTPVFDEDYWVANLRRPVRFTHALAAAMADGHQMFVEISPHPIAATAVEQTATVRGHDAVALPTLSRRAADRDDFLTSLAALHAAGHPSVLARRYPDGPVLDLPGPAWQHERYWAEPRRPAPATGAHPLLGVRVEVPEEARELWQSDLDPETLPWLADHQVQGMPVLPGTAYLEMAMSCGRAVFGVPDGELVVRDLELAELLPVHQPVRLCTEFRRLGPDRGLVRIRSKTGSGDWIGHATAEVLVEPAVPVSPWAGAIAEEPPLDLYRELALHGQSYGPAFRGLHGVHAARGRASAGIALPEAASDHPAFTLHPALGDACLHTLAAAAAAELNGARGVYLPAGIGSVRLPGDPRAGVRCRAAVRRTGDELLGAVRLMDAEERVVAELTGVRVRRLSSAALPVPLHDKLFETRWVERPLPAEPSAVGRDWLVLTDDRPASLAQSIGLATALAATGDSATALPVAELADGLRSPAGVVLIAAQTRAYRDPAVARELLLTVSTVVRRLAGSPTRLYLAVRNAAVVTEGEHGEPGAAALRALVRVLAFEHPGLRVSLVDLDPASSGAALAAELRAVAADDEVAWRDGRRYVARVVRTAPADPAAGSRVRPGGYLISGGLGAFGLLTAGWLAGRGAKRIVLCGRTGPSPEVSAVLDRLRERGTDIRLVLGDIAEPAVVRAAVDRVTEDGVRLHGVVHAAGVPDDRPVTELTEARLAEVWRPKVLGGRNLHEATQGHDLDWWLGFSSAAALFGSPGQAAHATADAWLDGLAASRRAQGLPATSVQWGAWATGPGNNPLLEPMAADEGLAALAAVLGAGPPVIGVGRIDLSRALGRFPELGRRPVFADLESADPTEKGLGATGEDAHPAPAPGPRPVAPRDPAERWVAGLWRAVLDAREFGVFDDFFELGGELSGAERIRGEVVERLGEAPEVDELFFAPTVAAMADLLRGGYEGTDTGPVRLLCERGDQPPLFLFHPAGGTTSVYRPLVDRLGDRQPCYGLERMDELGTLEEKAARYVELVRVIQPEGRYRLGGWSFGGMLAYEVARQLTEAGCQVDAVILIGTVLPRRAAGADEGAGRFLRHVRDVYGMDLALSSAEQRELDEPGQVDLVLGRLAAVAPGTGDAVLRHQYTSYVDTKIAERYRPKPYAGPVLLCRAADERAPGWDELCPSLRVVTVPGDQLTMIDPPQVDELAERLGHFLEGSRDVQRPPA